jgi:hypothetical protein
MAIEKKGFRAEMEKQNCPEKCVHYSTKKIND